jgi:hypothetical protein
MIFCLLMFVATAGVAQSQTGADADAEIAKAVTAARVDTAVNKRSVPDTTTVNKRPEPVIRHEIGLYVGGGMSALNYTLDARGSKTDGSGGISGHIGLTYTWNINDYFGIVTGAELASYGAKSSYDAVAGNRMYGECHFHYSINNYVEEQSITFISIPVMFQYSAFLDDVKKIYLAGGFKLGLPVNAAATLFPGTIKTWGEYVFEKQPYDDITEKGFEPARKPGSIPLDIDETLFLAASLETGVRFVLTDKILLYTGAYCDYGLNNIRSSKNNDIIAYQEITPSILKYASILNTGHVNKVKIFGAGLRVRVSFGW